MREALATTSHGFHLVSDAPIPLSLELLSPIINHPSMKPVEDLEMAHVKIRALESNLEGINSQLLIQHLHIKKLLSQSRALKKKRESAKAKMFVDGKGCHLTDENFIAALNEGEENKKAKEREKEGRKQVRANKRKGKEAIEKQWQKMVTKWSAECTLWEGNIEQLTKDGVPKKNHPKPPKKPTKAQAEAKLKEKGGLGSVVSLTTERALLDTDNALSSDSGGSSDLELDSD